MKLSRCSQQIDSSAHVATEGDVTGVKVTPFSEPMADLLGSSAHSQRIVLNLESARIIDSSGISWLVELNRRCCQAGGNLVLHSVTPAIIKVLRILRIDRYLRIAPNADAANQLISQGTL